MRNKKLYIFLLISLLFYGCTQQPPPAVYKENSIKIMINADDTINQFNGTPHTLLIRVYQLSKIQGFKVLIADKKGIETLMRGDIQDSSYVTNNLYVVMPGEKKELVLDRFDDTKFIGIVAGFYEYEDIKNIFWHSIIPHAKEYNLLGNEYYKDLNLSLKINRDSIHVKNLDENNQTNLNYNYMNKMEKVNGY